MTLNFPLLLVIAVAVCGALALVDLVLFAPRRRAAISSYEGQVNEPDPAVLEKLNKEPLLVEYGKSFFPVLFIVLVLRSFLVEPFQIPSGSMKPTLEVGDFILVNKFAYGIRLPVLDTKVIPIGDPQRGDVMVFRYPSEPNINYIKRVVGLPGDRIQMRQGQLFLNDRPVTRVAMKEVFAGSVCGGDAGTKVRRWRETLPNGASYVTYDCIDNGYYDNTNVYTVPPGHIFVLGDNRDNSTDSRVMTAMGFVPMDNLVGKAVRIFWSLDSRGELRPDRMGKVW